MHDQMVTLLDRMLDLNKKLPEATVPQINLPSVVTHATAVRTQEGTTIQRPKRATRHYANKIDSTDKQIDQLVYKLYDLTDEEIKIVEGALQ